MIVRNLELAGVIAGTTMTAAVPDFTLSAVLVALIVTGFGSGVFEGAV